MHTTDEEIQALIEAMKDHMEWEVRQSENVIKRIG